MSLRPLATATEAQSLGPAGHGAARDLGPARQAPVSSHGSHGAVVRATVTVDSDCLGMGLQVSPAARARIRAAASAGLSRRPEH